MSWIYDADLYLPAPSDFMEVNKAAESQNPIELRTFAHSIDPNVRAQVAANPYTEEDILERFKEDIVFVQLYLLRNPKLNPEFVKKYIGETNSKLKLQAYNLILQNFKFGKADLTGKRSLRGRFLFSS